MHNIEKYSNPDNTNTFIVKVIYILYLTGIFFGITALIGVVMAYVYRNKSGNPDWLNTHYRLQIRTFWYGLIYLSIGLILSFILIGWVLLLWFVLWLIIRTVKGMSALDDQREVTDPTSFWGFGFK